MLSYSVFLYIIDLHKICDYYDSSKTDIQNFYWPTRNSSSVGNQISVWHFIFVKEDSVWKQGGVSSVLNDF